LKNHYKIAETGHINNYIITNCIIINYVIYLIIM